MRTLVHIFIFVGLSVAALPHRASATEQKAELGKRQVAALLAAVDAMRRHGYGFRGQQVVITDHGGSYHVTFMEDPIDVAVVGGHHAKGWEIRKRDARVIRELLVR